MIICVGKNRGPQIRPLCQTARRVSHNPVFLYGPCDQTEGNSMLVNGVLLLKLLQTLVYFIKETVKCHLPV